MRIMASVIILLALSPSFKEAYFQDSGLKPKSYKNWFARGIEVTLGRVTAQDLLDSPNNRK